MKTTFTFIESIRRELKNKITKVQKEVADGKILIPNLDDSQAGYDQPNDDDQQQEQDDGEEEGEDSDDEDDSDSDDSKQQDITKGGKTSKQSKINNKSKKISKKKLDSYFVELGKSILDRSKEIDYLTETIKGKDSELKLLNLKLKQKEFKYKTLLRKDTADHSNQPKMN